jgi:DNA-binding CsgD family transcriptional regulator
MYLTEDEGRVRIAHPKNLVNAVVEFRRKAGRPTGSTRLSPAAREIVAQAARVLPPIEVAEAFGISRRTASNLSRGITSNMTNGRQKVNEDLKDKLDRASADRAKVISGKALDILMATLEGVDPTKVKSQTAKVKMAKDLATIHEKMNGTGQQDGFTKVLIYAPRQRDMKEFEILDVQAKVVS